MSGDVTVTSTTDTQEAVDAAASYGNLAVEQPDVEKAEPSVADEAETVAKSEPAPEEEPEKEPEEGEEEEEETPEQAMGKTRRKLLRTVSRLNSERYALQEQLEIARERIRQFERSGGKQEPAAAAPPSGRPERSQFASDEAYVEGLVSYELNRRAQADAQAKLEEYRQQVYADYNRQVESARDEYEDFQEVVDSEAKIPQRAIDTMYQMPNGAQVAYYLGKHPEVREQLLEWNEPFVKGGQDRITAELYRISNEIGNGNGNGQASVPKNGSPKPSRARTAPAPITPVGGGATTRSVATPPDQLPYRDFVKWREGNGARR